MSAPLWRPPPADGRVDVVGMGQCSIDYVGDLEAPPPFAGKAALRAFHQLPGGQVATAVLACARLGLSARFLGRTGDDDAGAAVLAPLREAGVDVAGVLRTRGTPTQCAVILVDLPSGERTVLWHRDAVLALRPGDFSREALRAARVLHVDGGDPDAAVWAAGEARAAGAAVVLDADTALPGSGRLLAAVDFPIVSREFAETYFGTRSLREALRGLAAGGARLAVVTLGELGALAQQGDRVIESPGFRVDARDTTGAGDAFHGGFIFALLDGRDAETALRTAHAVAALNCTGLGAQGGLPDGARLARFLAGARLRAWREPEERAP